MMALEMKVRLIALIVVVCCLVGVGGQVAQAETATPTVTVSPGDLSFGVPVGTPMTGSPLGLYSAQQTVTVAITGSQPVALTSVSVSGSNASDFLVTLNSCTGTFTPPAACQVGVTFKSTLAAGLLETGTLSISSTGNPSPLTVALNGAFGAIELFSALNVNKSLFGDVTWQRDPATAGEPVKNTTVTLSCPASPTAVLSSTPDGVSNVFQDNTIQVADTVSSEGGPITTTTTNVCYGGDPQFLGFTGFPAGTSNCFKTPYEGAVTQFVGQNPDLATATITETTVSLVPVYGVQPLDLMAPPEGTVYGPVLVPGTQQLNVQLVDAGGFLGAATLHLVTNCTSSGVQTGGTITGNPINSGDPASQTPQFTFDATTGQHIALSANYLALAGTPQIATNTVPASFDTGLTQTQFATMVAGTSAGPAVCMRLSGELAADGVTPLCKAITLECTNGDLTNPNRNTPAGVNCPQQLANGPRNLLFTAAFDTPDPINIAPGTGPGFLMGQDNWAASGPNSQPSPIPCTFGTDPTADPLANQLCPQDTLTSFIGGDPNSGGTTRTTNSTFIPVLNMPLPITLPVVTSANIFGWQRDPTTVKVKFFSSPAIYPFFFNFNPLPANGFTAAPIQSVTFGTTAAGVPVPDTTLPISTDPILYNPGGIGGVSTCPLTAGGIFTTSATITSDTSTGLPLTEGRYNLHFFATDCASTEELRFTPKSSPTANWASFKTVPIRIDMTKPTIAIVSISSTTPKAGDTVTVKYRCTDPALADTTPGSGVVFCGTYLFFAVSDTGTVANKFVAKGIGTHTFTAVATDLAGNTSVPASVNYTVH